MRGFLAAVRAEYRANAWAVRGVWANKERAHMLRQYRQLRESVRADWPAHSPAERAPEVAWMMLFRDHADGRLPDFETCRQWREDAKRAAVTLPQGA